MAKAVPTKFQIGMKVTLEITMSQPYDTITKKKREKKSKKWNALCSFLQLCGEMRLEVIT